jgi:hypothetical protein
MQPQFFRQGQVLEISFRRWRSPRLDLAGHADLFPGRGMEPVAAG